MNELSHPWSRLIGVVLGGVIIFYLDTNSTAIWHQLYLPLGLAVAAYLMTRSSVAVAFAAFALAIVHTNVSSDDWIVSRAYPAIAAIGLVYFLVISIIRFRQRIRATHDDRWADRH